MTLSAEALAALGSHDQQVASRVEVLRDGQVVRELAVDGGSVTIAAGDGIRRRCTIELHDPDGLLTPATATDLLAPFGTELRLSRGVELPGGAPLVEHIDTNTEWDAGTHDGTAAVGGRLTIA